MGFFKKMKQMNEVVKEAPGMVQSAQEMQQAAQQQAAAQAAAAQQAAAMVPGAAPAAAGGAGSFEPIAGVSIELYAEISRELTNRGGDQSLAPVIAAEKGVDQASWDAAVAGWNQRMVADKSVAQRFNQLWRGVG